LKASARFLKKRARCKEAVKCLAVFHRFVFLSHHMATGIGQSQVLVN